MQPSLPQLVWSSLVLGAGAAGSAVIVAVLFGWGFAFACRRLAPRRGAERCAWVALALRVGCTAALLATPLGIYGATLLGWATWRVSASELKAGRALEERPPMAWRLQRC